VSPTYLEGSGQLRVHLFLPSWVDATRVSGPKRFSCVHRVRLLTPCLEAHTHLATPCLAHLFCQIEVHGSLCTRIAACASFVAEQINAAVPQTDAHRTHVRCINVCLLSVCVPSHRHRLFIALCIGGYGGRDACKLCVSSCVSYFM
jgi:hypothetical protein